MKTKICIVNPFEHGGGAEYQISLLIDALVAAGDCEIHYLAHFVDERERERSYEVARIGRGPIPRLGYLAEARALYGRLAQIGPDVIYQRVACGYTGICAFYSQRRGVPLLWHVAHDTEVTPQHLDPGRNLVRLRLEKWAVEYGIRHATRIVVQTQQQAQLLQRHYSRSADAVVPNFHPPAAEIIDKSGPLTVVWIANLKPWKQPEVFVRLARRLERYPEVRFVMVGAPPSGAGNASWQQALMREVESTGNLRYIGEKSHAEVNALLARAHIFVNTSTHEGFPNTFIQAWMRDTAVVSLSVDPDGILETGQVGIAARSEEKLAQAVGELIERPELRAAYAARGGEHAHAQHSLTNARRLAALLGSHGNPASAGRAATLKASAP